MHDDSNSFTKEEFKYCAAGICNSVTAMFATGAAILIYVGCKSSDNDNVLWFGFSAGFALAAIQAAAMHIDCRYKEYHRQIKQARKLVPMLLLVMAASAAAVT